MRHISSIWHSTTDDEFSKLFSSAISVSDFLLKLGFSVNAGNRRTLRKRCDALSLDLDAKAKEGLAYSGSRLHRRQARSNEELFIENGPDDRKSLRKRLLKDQIIPYVCAICGMEPIWNDLPITLTLDHINGVNNDHRLSNLRFVCPNCDSQLSTYGSRNRKMP